MPGPDGRTCWHVVDMRWGCGMFLCSGAKGACFFSLLIAHAELCNARDMYFIARGRVWEWLRSDANSQAATQPQAANIEGTVFAQ